MEALVGSTLLIMDTNTPALTPQAWAKEAWQRSRLELLVPATAGLALGELLMALFALHSYHTILLMVSIGCASFSALRTFAFLVQLSRNDHRGEPTTLSAHDIHQLFLPLLLSVVVYGIIAPNLVVGFIFACISLPHAAALLYLTKRHATLLPSAPLALPRSLGEFRIRARVAILALAFDLLRAFRRTPDLTRP